ncbi:hypothetical protein [Plesiomonas shigelloides]|uniref:hypothetical protein n=1 Tax=Plesiomonas shigelloides TaxID=703 RepID=UPI00387F0F57
MTDDLVSEPIGTTKKLSYAVEQRMRLIDFMLKHFGYFKTAALRDHFGISEPQSLKDVRLYKKTIHTACFMIATKEFIGQLLTSNHSTVNGRMDGSRRKRFTGASHH